VVRRSIDLKAAIVEEDEREGDRRRILNYGHTIGHGIEAALRYEGLTHGEAVAWGMIAANAIACRRGVLSRETSSRIESAIRKYEPRAIPPLDRDALLHAVSRDKKFAEGKQVMIFAREIGQCEIVTDVTEDELRFGVSSIL
jgi:3-dehydroquinate synthetase